MSRRSAVAPGLEYRTARTSAPKADGDRLSGLAAPFNIWTMIGSAPWGFRERIAPGTFKKALNDGDTVLLDNHDTARPLARKSAGTLELREGAAGLDWDAEPADTSYARDVAANVRAGNYGGCSFGFEVVRDSWAVGDDGIDERTLHEVKLPEISIVTFPAYTDTLVSARDACQSAREAYAERAWRAKYSGADKKAMLAKGHAFQNADGDPSYPIADEDDLDKAIKAVGRGGADHDAIRKYVIGRANALGLSAKIPGTWNADGSLSEANSARPAEQRMPTAPYSVHDGEDAECGQCHSVNDAGAYFCDQCGTKMDAPAAPGMEPGDAETHQCQSCLSMNGTDAKYCDQCGTEVAGIRPYKLPGGGYTWDRAQAVTAIRAAVHAAFAGTHSHAHGAMGSQGGDDGHEHEHSHDGDASHDHHSGGNVSEQNSATSPGESRGSEPATATRADDADDVARRMRARARALRMRREQSDVELATTTSGGSGHAGDAGDRAQAP